MNNRLSKLRDALAQIGADALITEETVNRRYLSGFTGSTGWVIVTEKEAFLVTDFRYVDQAQEECPHFTVVNNERKPLEAIAQVLKKAGVKRLAFESSLSFGTYSNWSKSFEGVELVPTSGFMEKLRMYKEESEVQVIRQAVKIAEDAFEHILGYIRPGVTEIEVALELEFFMRRQGASASAFDIIVASGHRGALPHGRASEKVIAAGEMVTLDFGAAYQATTPILPGRSLSGSPILA